MALGSGQLFGGSRHDQTPALLRPWPAGGRAAVFLDKDGTLIDDVPHNVDPSLIRLAHGAAHALSRLAKLRLLLVVVSNQPGVARGYFSEAELMAVHGHLAALFEENGAQLAGFYYCPHDPRISRCDCRKPAAGLLRSAARELDIDLHRSWMVGDILDDVEAGNTAGCRTLLIDNGNETEWRLDTPLRRPEHIARNMSEAADRIAADMSAAASAPHAWEPRS